MNVNKKLNNLFNISKLLEYSNQLNDLIDNFSKWVDQIENVLFVSTSKLSIHWINFILVWFDCLEKP